MTDASVPDWVVHHYQESRLRFISHQAEFAQQNKDDYAMLQQEVPNLWMATNWGLHGQSETAVDLVNDLGNFFLHRGYWREGLDFADRAVSVAQYLCTEHPTEEKHTYALASIQVMRVGFHLLQGNAEKAGNTLQELLQADNLLDHQMISGGLIALIAALTELRGEDDKSLTLYRTTLEQLEKIEFLPLVSYLLYVIADLLTQQGKYEEAIAMYWQKFEVDRKSHDISSMIETLQGLGGVARSAGLPKEAEECYQQAAALAQSISSPELQHDTIKEIAKSAYEQGDYATAAQLYEQALAFARQAGNKWATASTLTFLAFAREELGEDVTGLLKESLSICQEMNDYDGMTMAMIQLGDAYLAVQNIDKAKELFAQAADLAAHIQNHPLAALAWLQMGDLVADQENWAEAERYYEQGLTAHLRFDDPASRAMVLRGLGLARFMQDKLESAKDVIQTNINLYAQLEDWENHATCLYELACILAQENNPVEARQLAQQSSDILHKIGSPEATVVDAALAKLNENGELEDST